MKMVHFLIYEKAVAEKVGLLYRNINIAFTNSFPILEGRINPVRDIVKQHAPSELLSASKDTASQQPTPVDPNAAITTTTTSLNPGEVTNVNVTALDPVKEPSKVSDVQPMDQDEDDDARENRFAEQENRDKRTFNFKAERATPIKKAKFSPLDIICWEDLRAKVEKTDPHAHPQTRNKKTGGGRDTDVLKIKN